MFILLQNQNVTPGTKWIIQPSESLPPTHYIAQIREFETDIEARQFAQQGGVVVPGKPWVLIFAGVADNTRCSISGNHMEMVDQFMEEAAVWLSAPTSQTV